MPRAIFAPALLLLLALAAAVACGGSVVVDPTAEVTLPPPDASVPPPDAAPTGCDDPTLCSRIQTHDGCIGPTTAGTFCDFFATPCAATLPDCAKLAAVVGAPTMPASCGGGLVFCYVNWTGTVDGGTLATLCAARDAVMAPVDCAAD